MPRQPEPTEIRVLKGNPGKRPLNKREPRPDKGTHEPPAWLTGAEPRKFWRHWRPMLDRLKVFTEADEQSLAELCREMARYVQANRVLDKSGLTYEMTTKAGDVIPIARPEIAISNSSLANVVKLSDRFGLNPSTRSRLKVEAEPPEDPLERLRSRHASA